MNRLLIDGTAMSVANKGVGRYTHHLCLQTAARLSDSWAIEIAIFSRETLPPFPEHFRGRFFLIPPSSEIVKGLISIPKLLRTRMPQVLLKPMDSVGYGYGVPTITVCHDIPELIRQATPRKVGLARRVLDLTKERMQRHALKKSNLVIFNSVFVQQAAAAYYGISTSSTAIGYCGVDPRFYEYASIVDINSVFKRYGVARYVLTFATGDYREGFDLLPKLAGAMRENNIQTCLLIAGVDRMATYFATLRHQLQSRELIEGTHFVFEDFLGEQQFRRLAELYSAADFYLELSRHEGFGMQLAEAMACGTTCISTGAGALREVAGAFAIDIKVDDVNDVVEALIKSYERGSHMRDNRDQVEHTRRFNWNVVGALVARRIEQFAVCK